MMSWFIVISISIPYLTSCKGFFQWGRVLFQNAFVTEKITFHVNAENSRASRVLSSIKIYLM